MKRKVFALAASLAQQALPQSGSSGSIPPAGSENDDHNAPRVGPSNLFDVAPREFTVVNPANKDALYNLLSTFSGTHFASPRAYTAEFGLVW